MPKTSIFSEMSNNDKEAIANGRGTRRAPSSSDGSV